MNTIESKVAETILQSKKEINVGGKVYFISAPTVATLIQVSKLISKLPAAKLSSENFIYESLSIAKDCEIIGEIAATLIIGVSKETITKGILSKWFRKDKNVFKELGSELLLSVSSAELETLIIEGLKCLEVQPFFQIITSLLEVNLLKATR